MSISYSMVAIKWHPPYRLELPLSAPGDDVYVEAAAVDNRPVNTPEDLVFNVVLRRENAPRPVYGSGGRSQDELAVVHKAVFEFRLVQPGELLFDDEKYACTVALERATHWGAQPWVGRTGTQKEAAFLVWRRVS